MQPAQMDAALPRRLGRYELLFRIASGGMAEVYAARVSGEGGFEKLVAVKRMLPGLAEDAEFVTMFLDEGRVAAHIESPHVVTTHDLGRAEDGSLYIGMELVVGITVSRALRAAQRRTALVDLPVALEILRQAALGLHDAHEARTPVGTPLQIVHRDVSPQNILVGADGRVRLTDFGVARAVLRATQTVGQQVKGKFAYASPEQLAARDLDRRSDVFSLGVVAWELLTGRRLFAGDHPGETIERVRVMPIPAVDDVRPEVPRAVAEVVASALQRDTRQRIGSARELASRLVSAAEGAGIALAEREELSAFVGATGGEELARMRDGIRLAMGSGEALEPSAGGEAREATPAALGQASGILERRPLPNRAVALGWIALGAVLLLGLGSAIGWWLTRPTGDGDPVQAASPAEAPAPSPASAPGDLEPEGEPSAAQTGRAARPEEAVDEGTEGTAEAEAAAEDEADEPRPSARRGRRVIRRADRPAMRAVTAEEEGPAPGPRGLVGLEEFERDLGR